MVSISGILSGGTAMLENALAEYGIWVFIGASTLKGMLLFFIIPAESVTPTYVLLAADSGIETAFIVLVASLTILAGNLVVYLVFRMLGERLIGEEQRRTGKWRLLQWACNRHGRASMYLFRLIPLIGAWAAIPAAIVKLDLKTFLIYSFLGILTYESLLGFGTFYGIKMGMFLETPYGAAALNLLNSTIT